MDKFERYWKLSEMEERFNSSSGGIRGLASAWLLASLGAIGWLFHSYNFDTWPLPLGFLIMVVTTLSCVGITTLWVMDQLVFHRLLSSVFLVGLKIEKDDHDIPPIRSIMMKTQEGLGTHRWERFFYLIPILIFIFLSFVVLIGGTNELFSVNQRYFNFTTRYISVFLVIIQVAIVVWMLAKFPSVSLKDRAPWFGDEKFTNVVNEEEYQKTISKFRSNLERHISNEG